MVGEFVCTTCGVQYPAAETSPFRCVLCEAEGRSAPVSGPAWTTLPDVARRHENIIQRLDEELYTIRTMPVFGIGQQAMLVRSPGGSVLWDCVTLVDDTTVGLIRALGGLRAIAVSHPRHFASAVEWSRAFDGIPVYVHETGRRWLVRPDPVVRAWEGTELRLHDGITLVYCGGNDGGVVLHWPNGPKGKGALLTGAVIQVVDGSTRVSFLSCPSALLPRSAGAVSQLLRALEGLVYDRLYDSSPGRMIAGDAHQVVLRSAEQYLAAVTGRDDRSPRGLFAAFTP
jgi:hypothetical protein